MNHPAPPTIDPPAVQRLERLPLDHSPWLHEEVARRMAERLQWIKLQPEAWLDWSPTWGGLEAHERLRERYPKARAHVHEPVAARAAEARRRHEPAWWQPARWGGRATTVGLPEDGSVQMVWSNMALHATDQPQGLIGQWHRALAVDGFLMFSCLGPDTLQELRAVYADAGWPVPGHVFTDMHDWGDMLVEAGFAEPVMDMERVVLTFESPERLLQELRELGRNLHPARFQACRGRGWHAALLQSLRSHEALTRPSPGSLSLTFEIIYGHAFKPVPRIPLGPQSAVSLQEMKAVLRHGKKNLPPV
ncbi:biotin synthase [Curvibacter sp. HBC61]|uniref:Biotin synthase n=1 Tax=Curvibacter cyanobacteriorum TaxID=3026422 RepID=A0ABT5N203_9BURK|nr:biotin synthase [Curvibacter sp. HBC61]MDD0839696.1 biotin synthase [Curvibacter sp. HBC61]